MPSCPRSHACCASKGRRAEPRAAAIHVRNAARATTAGPHGERHAARRVPRPGPRSASRPDQQRDQDARGPGERRGGGGEARQAGPAPGARRGRRPRAQRQRDALGVGQRGVEPRWAAGRASTSPGPPASLAERGRRVSDVEALEGAEEGQVRDHQGRDERVEADRQGRRHHPRQQREEGEVGEDLADLARCRARSRGARRRGTRWCPSRPAGRARAGTAGSTPALRHPEGQAGGERERDDERPGGRPRHQRASATPARRGRARRGRRSSPAPAGDGQEGPQRHQGPGHDRRRDRRGLQVDRRPPGRGRTRRRARRRWTGGSAPARIAHTRARPPATNASGPAHRAAGAPAPRARGQEGGSREDGQRAEHRQQPQLPGRGEPRRRRPAHRARGAEYQASAGSAARAPPSRISGTPDRPGRSPARRRNDAPEHHHPVLVHHEAHVGAGAELPRGRAGSGSGRAGPPRRGGGGRRSPTARRR